MRRRRREQRPSAARDERLPNRARYRGFVIVPWARYRPEVPQGRCISAKLFSQYHRRRKREEAGSVRVYLRQ